MLLTVDKRNTAETALERKNSKLLRFNTNNKINLKEGPASLKYELNNSTLKLMHFTQNQSWNFITAQRKLRGRVASCKIK